MPDEVMPSFNIPYDYQNGAVDMATAYYQLNNTVKANDMMSQMADKEVEYITFYLSLDDLRLSISRGELEYHTAVLDRLCTVMRQFGSDKAEDYDNKLQSLFEIYQERTYTK